MSKKIEVIAGAKFGRLTVLSESDSVIDKRNVKNTMCECICECGNTSIFNYKLVRTGKTRSCGCIVNKHGMYKNNKKTRLYQIWEDMKARCRNPNRDSYPAYGGRGIKVCEQWIADFNYFHSWAIKNGYSETLTIDRMNVNGNYEPLNCRWATAKEQCRNKRNNRLGTYLGETKTLAEWASIYSLDYDVLGMRINRGWDMSRALTQPVKIIGRKRR